MKPDVSAPGVDITSSVPPHAWARGRPSAARAWPRRTSPGAAALLRQRHPDWTVAQIKSALVLTGKPVVVTAGAGEAPTTREGGGLIDVPAAERPARLRLADRSLVRPAARPGARARGPIDLADAGGGAGPWTRDGRPRAPAGVTAPVPGDRRPCPAGST